MLLPSIFTYLKICENRYENLSAVLEYSYDKVEEKEDTLPNGKIILQIDYLRADSHFFVNYPQNFVWRFHTNLLDICILSLGTVFGMDRCPTHC